MYCSCIEVAVCRIPGGKHENPLELHPHHNPKHHWKILLLLVDQPDGNYLRNMYLHLLITQIFPYPNNIGFVCPRELIWNSSVSIFICPARPSEMSSLVRQSAKQPEDLSRDWIWTPGARKSRILHQEIQKSECTHFMK